MASRWLLAAIGFAFGAQVVPLHAQSTATFHAARVQPATSATRSSPAPPSTRSPRSPRSTPSAHTLAGDSARDPIASQPARVPSVIDGFGVAPDQIVAARVAWTADEREYRQALTRDRRLLTLRPDGVRLERAARPVDDAVHSYAWPIPGNVRATRSRVVWDQPQHAAR